MLQDETKAILSLEKVSESIGTVENSVKSLVLNFETLGNVSQNLKPVEAAKLNVAMAFALANSYFVLMNIKGEMFKDGQNLEDGCHPIKQDIGRIKTYFSKIKDFEEKLKRKQPEFRLDKDAATRFITHNMATIHKKQKR